MASNLSVLASIKNVLAGMVRKYITKKAVTDMVDWCKSVPNFVGVAELQKRVQQQLFEVTKDSLIDASTGRVRIDKIHAALKDGCPSGQQVFQPTEPTVTPKKVAQAAKVFKQGQTVKPMPMFADGLTWLQDVDGNRVYLYTTNGGHTQAVWDTRIPLSVLEKIHYMETSTVDKVPDSDADINTDGNTIICGGNCGCRGHCGGQSHG